MLDEEILDRLGAIPVIGLGKMGNHYIEALLNMGVKKDSIVGVDINPENLKKVKAAYPGPTYTTELEDVSFFNPDVVLIAVNSVAHLKVIEQCCKELRIRKIFVEKPLVYNKKELDKLKELGHMELYTSYLINFSQSIPNLLAFMEDNDLAVAQTRAIWGKNWPGENRAMGGDAEEEMPHSLALALSLIEFNQTINDINDISCFAKMSTVPHVQPQYLEQARKMDYAFPKQMNDTTIAQFMVPTTADRTPRRIPISFLTSFNMYKQRRELEIDLVKRHDINVVPLNKACLEFDIGPDTDRLSIKEAKTNKELVSKEFVSNKLVEQLEAVLKAFAKKGVDKRLVDFNKSARMVELIQKVIESDNP